MLQHDRKGLVLISGKSPGRSKIDQFDLAIFGKYDIIRADISMDHSGFMDFLKCLEDRFHIFQGLFS